MAEKKLSHVQGKGCLSHNNRLFTPKNTNPERKSFNTYFIRENISDSYEKLFGNAVKEYNSRQKRNDRKITCSYFEHLFHHSPCSTVLESPNGQKSFYEDVVQIGTKDDTGCDTLDSEKARWALVEYMENFQRRNPNFYVFNAVLHMDEATPHLHIDYIPIGHYERGLSVQNGLAQALFEMGYGKGKDAINRWRKAEREELRRICEIHEIHVADEDKGRGFSYSCEEYKEYRETINGYEKQVSELKSKVNDLSADIENKSAELSVLNDKKSSLQNEVDELTAEKEIIETTKIKAVKMPLHKLMIDESEITEIENMKKSAAVKSEELSAREKVLDSREEQLNKSHSLLTERENGIAEKEQSIKEKLKEIAEHEEYAKHDSYKAFAKASEVDPLFQRAKKALKEAERMKSEQKDINKVLESYKTSNSHLKSELTELRKSEKSIRDEYSDHKRTAEKEISRLKTESETNSESYRKEISELNEKLESANSLNSSLSEKNKSLSGENEQLSKNNNFLNGLIDTLYEIGRFICNRLKIDFDRIVDQRLDGYSLKYIFGDNGRER